MLPLRSKRRAPGVCNMLVLAVFVLASCAHSDNRRAARSVTQEEERVIHAAVSQLPNESTIKPYVIASELFVPPAMFDPNYDTFEQRLLQSAKRKSPAVLSAVKDFLEKNQPTRSVSMDIGKHQDVWWIKSEELNRLFSTAPHGDRMEWFQSEIKYGTTPRYFRVSRPGMDQSKTTAIIYVGVHYPVGPAYGELHVLRWASKQWIVEHDEQIGPTWAF